jgi:hypothetical protein
MLDLSTLPFISPGELSGIENGLNSLGLRADETLKNVRGDATVGVA